MAVPPQETQPDSQAPFGAGLGEDFEPHPTSIVIGPRHDHKKLKVRKTEQCEKSEDD